MVSKKKQASIAYSHPTTKKGNGRNASTKKKPKDNIKEIAIRYEKTETCRTAYVDGVFGGINGVGLLDMRFFVIRHSIPLLPVTGKVKRTPQGLVVSENIPPRGITKEIELGIIMSMKNVERFRNWLTVQIKTHKAEACLQGKRVKGIKG